jgi:FkbM family methyltransferase
VGYLRSTLRRLVRHAGYDIVPIHNAPRNTFLGIGGLNVQTVIDVGANRGQFAKNARKLFPNAIIHCFEPLPMAAEALEHWAASQAGKIRVHRMAVGAEKGRAVMWHHIDHDPSSSLLPTTSITDSIFPQTRRRREIEVAITTLDSHFGAYLAMGLGRLLVKVDVQGFEDRVIAGGQKIFRIVDIAILEISVRSLYEGQPGFSEILFALKELGLFYIGNLEQIHDAKGQPIYFDAVFARAFPFSSDDQKVTISV